MLIWPQLLCQAAPVITYLSKNDGKKEVHTLNIQNKVQVLSDSSGSSHNNESVYLGSTQRTTCNNFGIKVLN